MQEFITIENENRAIIKGVTKVISSLPTQVVLVTNESTVTFSGANFEVKKLDIENGEVVLEGTFSNIKFSKKGDKQPLFKRIFK